MKTVGSEVRARLRALKIEKHWTQEKIAEALQITQSDVSYILNGRRRGTQLDHWVALAGLFGYHLSALIAEAESRVVLHTTHASLGLKVDQEISHDGAPQRSSTQQAEASREHTASSLSSTDSTEAHIRRRGAATAHKIVRSVSDRPAADQQQTPGSRAQRSGRSRRAATRR